MQHLPKQAVFLGRALQARFDCSQQPLSDELNVLLWFLDGADGDEVFKNDLTLSRELNSICLPTCTGCRLMEIP
jgi:hypothetical protein